MLESLSQATRATTATGEPLVIGPMKDGDNDQLFVLFSEIVSRREGFPHQPPLTRAVFEETWHRPVTVVVAATINEDLAGAYYLKPNQPGLGSHIANAGYVVGRLFRGQGIGRRLVEDSIARAPLAGFDAVQFNFVFADNPARAMYEELGWRVIGTVPDGAGPSRDALVYWRRVP